MKKTLSLIVVVILAFSLSACSPKSKPSNVVSKYCEAMKTLDYEKMASCVVPGGSDAASSTSDIEERIQVLIDFFKECANDQSYEITGSDINGDEANVTVKFTYDDATNIISETLQEYLLQAFQIAFSNPDDNDPDKILMDAFLAKKDTVKLGVSEKTVVFHCVKAESEWLIDKVPDEIQNVLSCNANTVFDALATSLDNSGIAESNSLLQPLPDKWNDVRLGETCELATINVTVTGCEEAKELSSIFGNITADEGTKFVVFTVVIENTTKSPITFNAYEMPLRDEKEREYRVYDDAWRYTEEPFVLTTLAPNIKKTGNYIYHVPEDSTDYYFFCGKSGTNEMYRFWGN